MNLEFISKPKKIKERYLIGSIILLSFLINNAWVSFDVFSFSDYSFKFSETLADFLNFSSWFSRSNLGNADYLLWRSPIYFLYGIIGKLGFDLNVADRFLVLWLWSVLSVVAPYLFVKQLIRSRVAAVVGSFVFAYNTYFLSINSQGHFYISIAACFGLLSLYCFFRFLRLNTRPSIIMTILFLFLCISYDLRVFYLFLGVYMLLYFFLIFNKKRLSFKFVRKLSKCYVFIFGFTFLLNLYWIMPQIVSGSLVSNSMLSRGLFGTHYWSLENAGVLFFPFWTGYQPSWFIVNQIPIYFYSIPIIVLVTLLLSLKNKYIIFFSLISIIGIILSNQSNPPFGQIYVWFFENVPGFSAFRDASKFFILIVIGYSVILGEFASRFSRINNGSYILIFLRLTVVLFIVLLFLINTKPILNKEIRSMHEPKNIPEAYVNLKNYMIEQEDFFRVLYVPRSSTWLPYLTNNHPSVSFLYNSSWENLYTDVPTNLPPADTMAAMLKSDLTPNILNQSSVKFIVLINDKGFAEIYNKEIEFYENIINDLGYYKKVNENFDEYVIYENQDYRPHIYQTTKEEDIYDDTSYSKVDFEITKTSEYLVEIDGLNRTSYINFSDAYNPNWNAIIGESDFPFTRNILPKEFHIRNSNGLNSFKLDPNFIKKYYKGSDVVVNQDGSISFNLTIFYLPDLFLGVGTIISIFSFVLLLLLSYKSKLYEI